MPTLQSAIDAAINNVVVLDPEQVYTLVPGQPAKITTRGLRIIGRNARVIKNTLNHASLVIFADQVRIENVQFEGPQAPTLLTLQPQSFTAVTLPDIGLSLPFSVNPFDCGWAHVVTAGDNISFRECTFVGAFGVAFLPHRSGRRAVNNSGYHNTFFDYAFGFNAYGQKRLTLLHTRGERPQQPSTRLGPLANQNGLHPGHLIYLAPGTGSTGLLTDEECWSDNVLIDYVTEDIGSASPITTMYTTIKANNTYRLRVGNVKSIGIPACLDFLGCSGFVWNVDQRGGSMSDDPTQWATFRWAVVLENQSIKPGNRTSGKMLIRDSTFSPYGQNVNLYRSERPGLTLRNVTFQNIEEHNPPVIYAGASPRIANF